MLKYRKQLQTETGSVCGPVLFTSCEMVYRQVKVFFTVGAKLRRTVAL